MEVTLDGNEAKLGSSLPGGTVYYIERSWDDASMTLKTEIKTLAEGSYTVLNNGDDITLQPGFYVVKGNIEVDDIILAGNGEHHFILCDGAQIEADILHVPSGQTAIIYGQANNSGRLYIPDGADDQLEEEACIGGRSGQSCGTVIIHGGDIDVVGRMKAAGIGGGKGGNGGTVTIYGGNITASGGSGAGAGIGGGNEGGGGIVTIYGGHIEAKGGNFGAGIGGGDNGNAATVTIHGGLVIARGIELGAGIGTGRNEDGSITYTGELTVTGGEVYAYGAASEFEGGSAGIGGGRLANGSKVTISGGYVYAKGGDFGAGIGSGCESLFGGGVQGGSLTVTGGRVEAYGGEDAAGIGGGEDADGDTVNISGGYVYAKGSYGGAGIGGGEGGDGGNVTITGGTVHASAGGGDTGNRAIGPGKGCDAYGQLTIGDEMMVTSERLAAAAERKNMCWYRTDARLEQCTHPGHSYIWSGTTAEDTHRTVSVLHHALRA